MWGERYESEILPEDPPPDAEEVGWGMAGAEADRRVPERMTYTLTWDSLRSPGKR